MEPHFSVIIPTFQEGPYLKETLLSLKKAGDGVPVETIVVDGGSRDATPRIAKAYAHKFYTGVKGIARARNLGASKARGKILVFLDADSKVPHNFFSVLEHSFSCLKLAGANCNVMPREEVKPSPAERLFYRLWGKARQSFYRLKPCGTGDNSIVVRRDVFRKIGGFREDFSTMEDLDFVFRASRHGRFLFLKRITLKESIRRFRHMGFPRFLSVYILNFLYYIFRKDSGVKAWEPVR